MSNDPPDLGAEHQRVCYETSTSGSLCRSLAIMERSYADVMWLISQERHDLVVRNWNMAEEILIKRGYYDR